MGLFKKKFRIMYSKKHDGYYIQKYSIWDDISIWENGWSDYDNIIYETIELAQKAIAYYRS